MVLGFEGGDGIFDSILDGCNLFFVLIDTVRKLCLASCGLDFRVRRGFGE